MSLENKPSVPAGMVNLFSRTVLVVAGQVGCLTFVIIVAALVLGLLLDRLLGTRPMFLILLLVGSMPLTWVAVYWVVNQYKERFIPGPASAAKPKPDWEEAESDRD